MRFAAFKQVLKKVTVPAPVPAPAPSPCLSSLTLMEEQEVVLEQVRNTRQRARAHRGSEDARGK